MFSFNCFIRIASSKKKGFDFYLQIQIINTNKLNRKCRKNPFNFTSTHNCCLFPPNQNIQKYKTILVKIGFRHLNF